MAPAARVLPLAHMKMVYDLARKYGIPVHTDGARFFNAAVALGVPAATIAQHTDSVCFCVSKGLSAPVGSVLCGSRAFIERARPFRRMVGGNLRQAGSIAAAGIVALEGMIDRLADDHATAKWLARGLHRVDPSLVKSGRHRNQHRAREFARQRSFRSAMVGRFQSPGHRGQPGRFNVIAVRDSPPYIERGC